MMLEGWTTLPAGVFISIVVSAMGIGGGILWMPFFLILLDLSPERAVLTSLVIQAGGTGSGSVAYLRQKTIDFRLAAYLLGIAVPGITSGAALSRILAPAYIELVLGLLVMMTVFLFVSSNQPYEDTGQPRAPLKRMVGYSWIAGLVSVGAGMLSTGLGEWLIPVLRTKLSLRMQNAIASLTFVTFGVSVIGAGVHILMGSGFETPVVLWGIPGVILGGQIGPRITRRIDERKLKEVFIFLLLLIGIHLIYNAW